MPAVALARLRRTWPVAVLTWRRHRGPTRRRTARVHGVIRRRHADRAIPVGAVPVTIIRRPVGEVERQAGARRRRFGPGGPRSFAHQMGQVRPTAIPADGVRARPLRAGRICHSGGRGRLGRRLPADAPRTFPGPASGHRTRRRRTSGHRTADRRRARGGGGPVGRRGPRRRRRWRWRRRHERAGRVDGSRRRRDGHLAAGEHTATPFGHAVGRILIIAVRRVLPARDDGGVGAVRPVLTIVAHRPLRNRHTRGISTVPRDRTVAIAGVVRRPAGGAPHAVGRTAGLGRRAGRGSDRGGSFETPGSYRHIKLINTCDRRLVGAAIHTTSRPESSRPGGTPASGSTQETRDDSERVTR